MMKDTRNPLPQAANKVVDEAKMCLVEQQKQLRAIVAGGMTEAEIYRRVALLTDLSHQAVKMLNQAQAIGKNGIEKEQE